MTIKQYIKENGWDVNCDTSTPHRYMNVDVVFEHDGKMDETQFSIKSFDTEELSNLFTDFCKENRFFRNTVANVVVVQVAGKLNELD